ncbi:MAG: DUF72 domain-containing protein [Promethearchaeota archaeon]
MSQIRVGCAGWSYDDWKGVFYPKGLKKSDFLGYYAKFFDFSEINSTFYAIPSQTTLNGWKKQTPDNFRFAVKVWQSITHQKNKGDLEQKVDQFFSSLDIFSPKISVFLLQFPPKFIDSPKNRQYLGKIIKNLPERNRYAIELRDNSWVRPTTVKNLPVDERFSLVTTYMPKINATYHPSQTMQYIRLIGDRTLTEFSHLQRDQSDSLKDLHSHIKSLLETPQIMDFFVIFNNHFRGFSPQDVNDFKASLGMKIKDFTKDKRKNKILDEFIR